MSAPGQPTAREAPQPSRRRRGRRPLLVLAGVVAGLGIAGAASGITLSAVGSDGPGGPGWGGPGHHRHGPPFTGQDGDGPGADRLVPPDQD